MRYCRSFELAFIKLYEGLHQIIMEMPTRVEKDIVRFDWTGETLCAISGDNLFLSSEGEIYRLRNEYYYSDHGVVKLNEQWKEVKARLQATMHLPDTYTGNLLDLMSDYQPIFYVDPGSVSNQGQAHMPIIARIPTTDVWDVVGKSSIDFSPEERMFFKAPF